nr:MAG TPA: hypothetical protein [Siphoviridae sp. ctD5s5]
MIRNANLFQFHRHKHCTTLYDEPPISSLNCILGPYYVIYFTS